MIYLAVSLPASPAAWHWRGGLGRPGRDGGRGPYRHRGAVYRRDARYCLASTATAALLLADAWFDVTTAPPGSGALASLLMAVLAECPRPPSASGLPFWPAARRCPRSATRGGWYRP